MPAGERSSFERRLRNHLARHAHDVRVKPSADAREGRRPPGQRSSTDLAERLRAELGGEVVRGPAGAFVRIEGEAHRLPLDRTRLERLPGGPPADAPLICLDTETTGLGSAAGTVAFLIGLGWWSGQSFRQVQLLLPDHGDEPAFLAALAEFVPATGWLVTYNGRGFDWPLIATRFRMAHRPPPAVGGHMDLLGLVRGVFRHRLSDGRLGTVERELLGIVREPDIAGYQIPARYLGFLQDGRARELVDVVRHNDEDVRSLARLLAHAQDALGDPAAWQRLPAGDLLGLARAYRREGRLSVALDCLEAAIDGARAGDAAARPAERATLELAGVERARLLRRLGYVEGALAAWSALALAGGRLAAVAWIEIAKIREHEERNPMGALEAADAAARVAERARLLGRPLPRLESDLARRKRRLRRHLARSTGSARGP
ncbi:MAG TPA: ribonuclease H-like domain-containing protein [Candidatus Limnocylindrales bacterium]